jgi:hypothetical protein
MTRTIFFTLFALLMTASLYSCSAGGSGSGGSDNYDIDTTPLAGTVGDELWEGTWVVVDENGNVDPANIILTFDGNPVAAGLVNNAGYDPLAYKGYWHMQIAISSCYYQVYGQITSQFLPSTNIASAFVYLNMAAIQAATGCENYALTAPAQANIYYQGYLLKMVMLNNNLAAFGIQFALDNAVYLARVK